MNFPHMLSLQILDLDQMVHAMPHPNQAIATLTTTNLSASMIIWPTCHHIQFLLSAPHTSISHFLLQSLSQWVFLTLSIQSISPTGNIYLSLHNEYPTLPWPPLSAQQPIPRYSPGPAPPATIYRFFCTISNHSIQTDLLHLYPKSSSVSVPDLPF